jgi:uncharacterized protein (TIGR02172 family)
MPVLQKPIAQGRTADVFLWDDAHILKLFHAWFDQENIKFEQAMARAVVASGVKSPQVGEIVQVGDRNGLIYERVPGVSMLDLFLQRPWKVVHFARRLAWLHARMHGCVFDISIPAQRSRIESKINKAVSLSAPVRTALLDTLASLPGGDRVCHGDFHPGNVLVSGEQETVIDWIDASRGNPLADVARTSILALGMAESSAASNPFLKAFTKTLHSSYLKQYFNLRPGGENEYRRWLPIVAAARLSENIPGLETWLLRKATIINP